MKEGLEIEKSESNDFRCSKGSQGQQSCVCKEDGRHILQQNETYKYHCTNVSSLENAS